MRGRAAVWIAVAGLVLVHFGVHVGVGVGRGAPDLLTVALLLAAREVGVGTAAGIGFGFGLLEDALTVISFGANALSLTIVGVLGAITRDLFVGDSLAFLLSYFVIGKWVRDLITWLMMGEAIRQPFVDQVVVHGFVGGVYAAAVGLVIMAVAGRWREVPR